MSDHHVSPLLGALALTVCACVTPPRSTPRDVTGARFEREMALAPPRSAVRAGPLEAFDDAGRRERVVSQRAALSQFVAEHFAATRNRGLALGVVLDDELVLFSAHGTGDGGRAIDEDSVFRIGSITKVITAMALLALRDAGKLSLDDPAARYLPELSRAIHPSSDTPPITLAQLLTHDAGLPRNGTLAPDATIAASEEAFLESLDGLALPTPPGFGPRYSNLGVATLSLIIAKIAGMSYRAYVERHILSPLGMAATTWEPQAVPAARLTSAHDGAGRPIPLAGHWRMGPAEAAGGLYASTRDLARLVAHQLGAWPARSEPDNGALRRATLRESQRMRVFGAIEARSGDGGRTRAKGTGLGWQVEQSCELEHIVWHNGGTEGYRSAIFMLPQRGVAVIALSNGSASVDALAAATLNELVARAALGPRKPQPSPALEQARQAIATMLEHGNINEPDYQALFAGAFQREVPLAALRDLMTSLRAQHGACKLAPFARVEDPNTASAALSCDDGAKLEVDITLDHGPPQRIARFAVGANKPSVAPERCE